MMNTSARVNYQQTIADKTDVYLPASTYRVQLNKEFTFADLRSIVAYLHELGITTIYAAPVLKSKPGSLHGYDVIDPDEIDPEIGDKQQLELLINDLKNLGIAWVQDIVPNHMAFDYRNTRLMDVLERGPHSPYYNFFDIDWDHESPELKGKVAVPFLGSDVGECVARNEIRLSLSEKGFTFQYFETSFPVSITAMELLSQGSKINTLNDFISKSKSLSSLDEWTNFREEWIQDNQHSTAITSLIESVNKDKSLLRDLLNHQYYVLMHWKCSEKEINYRRFFTINELICLRMENKSVFDEYHATIASLVQQGLISGVRIDHIDGLYDPTGYLTRLRQVLGKSAYIIAEKILESKEQMPGHWPVEGSSGYEFLSFLNQLMTDGRGVQKLVQFYQGIREEIVPYQKMVYENKKLILEQYMGGEWKNLASYFVKLKLSGAFDPEKIKQAIGVFMLSLDVYRIYPDQFPLEGSDLQAMERAFARALTLGKDYTAELEYLRSLCLQEQPSGTQEKMLNFLKRMMQFTGPLTAKGVEDTTFYVYNPLISHDEVGDTPADMSISIDAFHSRMLKRMKLNPHSLNATATHDTKRGEDARIRLNVLSELADVWQQHVTTWRKINEAERTGANGKCVAPNDEYLIYQALVGGFPEDLNIDEHFLDRFNAFMMKAVREAKVNSNWSAPDMEYEERCVKFVRAILARGHAFRKTFDPFLLMVIRYSWLYALGQVLLKVTAPGIPDIYQGCELWDLSFVDPDNRRPVDYNLRNEYLSKIKQLEEGEPAELFNFLKTNRSSGVEKMFVIRKTLQFRKRNHHLFSFGEYVPLKVAGNNTVAISFGRCFNNQWVIVIVPLALAANRMLDQPYSENAHDERFVFLPEGAPSEWKNIFTGEHLRINDKLPIFDALKDFPVALLAANCE
jgi:(1->4)-alpha-D-glucan 1-alpha-D-glucosylmutase